MGPAGNVPRCERLVNCYVIWNFSPHQDLAKQFLIDHAIAAREPFIRSGFYNMPSFPASVPDLAALTANDAVAKPAGKYGFLADAASWMTNIGAPGSLNPAIDEVFNRFILPRMFGTAARGERSPEEAVADAEAEIRPIFDKWHQQGKI